jgi:hypothetical protein
MGYIHCVSVQLATRFRLRTRVQWCCKVCTVDRVEVHSPHKTTCHCTISYPESIDTRTTLLVLSVFACETIFHSEAYCALWPARKVCVLGMLFYVCNSICKRSVRLPSSLFFLLKWSLAWRKRISCVNVHSSIPGRKSAIKVNWGISIFLRVY